MILPCLNYACDIWGNTLDTRLKNLVVLQKRDIILVDKDNNREHLEPLFSKYKCLKLCDIINLKTIITFQAVTCEFTENVFKNLCMFITIILDPIRTKGNFEVTFV